MAGRFLYTIAIYFLGMIIRILAAFKPPIKKWVEGRLNWQQKLKNQVSEKVKGNEKVIWLHAASTGEFEQGKPVLEAIKSQFPAVKIIVSFFSPSGYEASKKSPLADIICYLPLDTPSQAKQFIAIIKPDLVLWIKYEYWWNHLAVLKKMNIPVLLVSAILQQRHPITKWYGGWYRKMVGIFTHVFVQNTESAQILGPYIPKDGITIAGDTRFDRVISITDNWSAIPLVKEWIGAAEKVIVAGSTWLDDIQLLQPSIRLRNEIKWIIVPHKIDESSLYDSLNIIENYLKFSDLEKKNKSEIQTSNVLIMDAIGYLSRLYKYATICYIGGGFTPTGIHNSLEAAVYGKPLIWGPRYNRYVEAMDLIERKGAFSVQNNHELESILNEHFTNNEKYGQSAAAAKSYVAEKAGATQKVMDFIYKNRLLTNE
jgi:3-deoxy-D-manno-octulosonic-acid transferase